MTRKQKLQSRRHLFENRFARTFTKNITLNYRIETSKRIKIHIESQNMNKNRRFFRLMRMFISFFVPSVSSQVTFLGREVVLTNHRQTIVNTDTQLIIIIITLFKSSN